eukprot:gene40171-53083_t
MSRSTSRALVSSRLSSRLGLRVATFILRLSLKLFLKMPLPRTQQKMFKMGSRTLQKGVKNGHKKILIIGGAGHGKSTFINSLHNYFNKKTLYEMEAVIPTKYLQPIEDSPCDTENPNPMNSTDSVTQRCTEYTFTKPFSRNTSVTFIDTPGLTD